jgi:uncharacterized protein YbcI
MIDSRFSAQIALADHVTPRRRCQCHSPQAQGSRMSDDQDQSADSTTHELVEAGGGKMPQEPGGSVRTALANALVGMKKQFYGRGPTAAKAWILDDYVFVAMEGGLTRNEETLLADGKEDVVRSYRLSFQETVGPQLMAAVSELVGRAVLTYHSQIVFDPPRTFEIFVLEPQGP